MAWQDTSVQVKYTSPSGREFSFYYENDLQTETDLKTATFTFPGRNGAYIQPLGRGGRRFPFSCTFYGANCIERADAFEAALCETGYGNLEYPTGQSYKVVPTGTIKKNNNLVTSANRSIVEITFAETITDEKFPTDSVQSDDAIAEAESSFKEAAAAEFSYSLAINNTSEFLNTKAVLEEQEQVVQETLERVALANPESFPDFKAIKTALNRNIREFVDDIENISESAKTIAIQICKLISLPAKAPVSALSKIESYASIAASLAKNFVRVPIGLNNLKNQYAVTKLHLQSLVISISGATAALVNADESDGGFASRESAVSAAIELAELLDRVQDYCDARIRAIQAIENENPVSTFAETSEAYSAMQEAAYLSIAHILNHSFTLKMRHVIVLDRDRQVLELLAELYGSVDEHLDEFISDNRLNINEIALIPTGREVAYYA